MMFSPMRSLGTRQSLNPSIFFLSVDKAANPGGGFTFLKFLFADVVLDHII